jgi:hypothetical protein
MPFHPAVEHLIRRVEELSGKPVHVGEDPSLQVMAVVTPARGVAPAHFVRYRPGVANLDYLIAYQLGFVERQLALDVNDPAEQYTLRSIPGKFSGLHLLCIEYVGFQKIDPKVVTCPQILEH